MTNHEELRRLATAATQSLTAGIADFEYPTINAWISATHPKVVLALLDEIDALRTRLAEVENDAARLDWIQRYLFGHKWNSVIDSGLQTQWGIWGGYRHITAKMIGNTFREAIDAAMQKEQA